VPLESIVVTQPDLVLLGTEFTASDPAIRQLTAAEIAVAVLGLAPSLRCLDSEQGLIAFGRLIGREQQAREFDAFFRQQVAHISGRVAHAEDTPAVLLEAHAGGATCCASPGKGEGIGDFVSLAKGENIGASVIPGMAGQLGLEYIIKREPAVYIGTGGHYMAARDGLVLGPVVACCFAVVGFAATVAEILRGALLQQHTPDSVRGRVSSLWLMQATIGPALGGMQMGLMAREFSPLAALGLGGIACIVAALAIMMTWPVLRTARLGASAAYEAPSSP